MVPSQKLGTASSKIENERAMMSLTVSCRIAE